MDKFRRISAELLPLIYGENWFCWAALPRGAMGLSVVCDCGIS